MNLTPKTLYPGGQLPAAAAILYTTPARTSTLITSAVFTNTDTVNENLTVHIVRSGGTPTVANMVIQVQPIAPNVAYVSPELPGRLLNAGDTIQALASVTGKVNCVIDGFEIA